MGYKLTSIKCLGCAYTILILSVNFTSAGLLKAIREAAVPKDMDFTLPAETVTHSIKIPSGQLSPPSHVVTPAEETNLFATLQTSLSKLSSAIQERADMNRLPVKKCSPTDFLCQTGLATGSQNQLSSAIIKSFGTMMTDMVNTTISRSLVDFMGKHGPATGETAAEEHKAMVQMAATVLQGVSSRVIKAFTFFIQVAISGAMQDLLHQLMNGVTTVYNTHQKSLTDLRAAQALNQPMSKIPKPSQQQEFYAPDPMQNLMSAGALTSLSYPGYDLMSSLKSNLFTGDTNSLVKKRGTSVLTPYGFLAKK